MPVEVEIRVPPELVAESNLHREQLADVLGVSAEEIRGAHLIRRSVDARKRPAVYVLRYRVYIDEPPQVPAPPNFLFKKVAQSEPAVIVGFGPAGMFAALRLLELGIKPIILERGKPVDKRRRDIAAIQKRGEVNPDSNYCFGEGGAGTFSDGKLYTRSTKRGSVERILHLLVRHGASPDILIDAHPHIGTNKLPQVVTAIRETILAHGGEIHFETRVASLIQESGGVQGVCLEDGRQLRARGVLLAVGHSARDVFLNLHHNEISIERKSFALGVRVEHPQQLIDEMQYKTAVRSANLPAAAYSFVAQCDGRGVFSFCMCPGGIICPAATKNDEIVVNGWSPSKRNSRFANSGIVVEVRDEDLDDDSALAGMQFQQQLEERAFILGGGNQVAPAQRLTDFVAGRVSQNLPDCSYLPGLSSVHLGDLFPPAYLQRLIAAFQDFDKNRRGFITDEAVVVAVESRTSSPIRIPREKHSLMHPSVRGLFPVGEGAGYAGGIMSAAMDGENAASALGHHYALSK